MTYANESPRFKIPWWETGETSSGESNEAAALGVEYPLESILRGLAGDDTDATISSGFAVSDNGGLSVSVAAGRGFVDGLSIYASGATTKSDLADDDVSYLYLKITGTTKRDRTFTVEASLSGAGMADAILIAAVTCASGSVTDIDNSPSGRAPRIPQTWGGIPQFRVVAPAGGDHTTLKAAVDASNAGDTIFVCAGTYTEAATITIGVDGLKIVGAGAEKTILDFTAADANHCIDYDGHDGIIIEDIAVQAAGGKTGHGIYGASCDDITIERVKISGFSGTSSVAVYINGGNRLRVVGCDIQTGSRFGVELTSCDDSHILHNRIQVDGESSNTAAAIYALDSDNALFSRNHLIATAEDASRLIINRGGSYSRILGNLIQVTDSYGADGVIELYAYNSNVSGVVVADNIVVMAGGAGYGIQLHAAVGYALDETSISGNTVLSGARGVSVDDARCTNTLIHGNKVATCTTGVSDSGADTNTQDND